MTRNIRWSFLVCIAATMLLSSGGLAQESETSGTPLDVVEQFKSSLDQDSVSVMCSLMAEDDDSGPLKPLHFEKMQSSLSELIKLWQYASFSYDEPTIDATRTPNRARVRVSISQLHQQVTFTLLKFGSSWYISDIEIYFK
jgi:hypothetical protein